MASQAALPSRLVLMQMKFQQKQLQEREQRRTELFGETTKTTTETTTNVTTSSLVKNGKVRAMFNERRRGAGIDRSQPLKPITSSGTMPINSKSTTGLRTNGVNTAPSNTTINKTRAPPTLNNVKRVAAGKEVIRAVNECNGIDVNDVGFKRNLSRDNTFDSTQSSHSDKSEQMNNNNYKNNSNNGIDNIMKFQENSNNNNNNDDDYLNDMTRKLEINNEKNNNNKIKKSTTVLAPVKTKKIAPASVSTIKTFPIANNTLTTNTRERRIIDSARSAIKVQAPPMLNKVKLSSKKTASTPVRLTKSITQMNQAPREVTPPAGMKTCPHCHRNFIEERLPKHEAVCAKLSTAKRKIFDASQHRVRGTEAEKYLSKKGKSQTAVSKPTVISLRANNANSALKKNNWRQKHEEFIAAIRAAKEMKAHLARGGKLSDLPPPPPSENPDYIQCPHCGRRFNEAAAERHIPKCANMMHNKPKPGAPSRASVTKRR